MGGVEKKTLVLAGAVVGLAVTNVYWVIRSNYWKGISEVVLRDYGSLWTYHHILVKKLRKQYPEIFEDEELVDLATSIKFEQTVREEFEGDFRYIGVIYDDDEEEEDVQ